MKIKKLCDPDTTPTATATAEKKKNDRVRLKDWEDFEAVLKGRKDFEALHL